MRKRNATAEETRTLLLETGRKLLIERGVPVEIKSVNLVDVAKAADRTTGSAYQLWRTQTDFHRDLACFVLGDVTYADTSSVLAMLLDHIEAKSPMPLVLRDAANTYAELMSRSREFFIYSVYWAVSVDDPTIREALRVGYSGFQADFAALGELLLETYELECVPPFTVDNLAMALSALSEGFVLRRSVGPDAAPTNIHRPEYPPEYSDGWSTFSCACEAIILQLTRPRVRRKSSRRGELTNGGPARTSRSAARR